MLVSAITVASDMAVPGGKGGVEGGGGGEGGEAGMSGVMMSPVMISVTMIRVDSTPPVAVDEAGKARLSSQYVVQTAFCYNLLLKCFKFGVRTSPAARAVFLKEKQERKFPPLHANYSRQFRNTG